MRSSVVLPEPLGPSTASVLPAFSSSSTPASARRSPKSRRQPVERNCRGFRAHAANLAAGPCVSWPRPASSMRRLAMTTVLLLLGLAPCRGGAEQLSPGRVRDARSSGGIAWRDSISVGAPNRGALVNGVQLPAEGADYFTWDFPLATAPNRPWRRWGNDDTIRRLLRVIAEYRARPPRRAARRRRRPQPPLRGPFGRALRRARPRLAPERPRRRRPLPAPRRRRARSRQGRPDRPAALARIWSTASSRPAPHTCSSAPGPSCEGRRKIVQKLAFHDDHMHVRFFARAGGRTG